MNMLKNIVRSFTISIKHINKKYKNPQVKMTPLVKISLLGLRIYLLILVALIVFKFIITLRG